MSAAVQEHRLSVARTARYATLGEPAGHVRRVWFVCHGYSQRAGRFIQYFAGLDDGHTYVVAPEGLSRFYVDGDVAVHGRDARVGASWMTREDRENEIRDYVTYLDRLYDHVFDRIERTKVEFVVLGFSQGAATASRWVAGGRPNPDRLILWAGLVPHDVDIESATTPFKRLKLTVVVGDGDELATPDRVAECGERLQRRGIAYDLVRFPGGHHLDKHVLSKLAT